jgi:FkbM family methyltransferase
VIPQVPLNVRRFILDIYAKTFSSKRLAAFNELLFQASLRARGYNNYSNLGLSGERHFIEKILRKLQPAVCVDVGANVGCYSQQLLSIESVKEVHAFEPLAEPFSRLEAMKREYGDRLVTVNKGVGQRNETMTIHYDPNATSLASLCSQNKEISFINNMATAEIEVVTLDHYFSRISPASSLDFIKIDTEGYEYEVLIGAQETIDNLKPKMIQIEHNLYHALRSQTIYFLASKLEEYDLFQMLPRRLVQRDPVDPAANLFFFSNFLFIRKDLSPDHLN